MNTRDFLLFGNQIQRLYAQECREICGQFALNRVELDVLAFLANNAPYDTAKDIVQLRGIAKSNVSTAVERLTERQMLVTQVDSEDRRRVHLILTGAASPAVRRMQEMQARLFECLLEGVSEEDCKTMERVHQTMQRNIRRAMKDDL